MKQTKEKVEVFYVTDINAFVLVKVVEGLVRSRNIDGRGEEHAFAMFSQLKDKAKEIGAIYLGEL